MLFKSDYIRVTTPITTNGVIPATVNGQVQTKETLLPLSAKKRIEAKNNRLRKNGFSHLMAKIEVVNNKPVTVNNVNLDELERLKAENEALKQKLAEPVVSEVIETTEVTEEKKRTGRPPKIKTN